MRQAAASEVSIRRLHELDYRQTAFVDQLIRLITGSALFSSRHTGLRRVSRFVESKAFGSILLEEINVRNTSTVTNILKSILNFKFYFNVFLLMIAVKCYNIFAISNQLYVATYTIFNKSV